MGSLMAGWDSPFRDPKYAAYQRNRSFTKEEIEAYWKSKKKVEEELRKATSSSSDDVSQEAGTKYQRSKSPPMTNDAKGANFTEMEAAAWEKLIKTNGWWTRSNWAFLNEPPVGEGTTNSYASQFHVADPSRSKLNDGAGSSP
ncbi:uncharacterized protein LOC116212923 [Punica granatum]|uniref:Uncharacterized protein n=2 Tax=Punica granatum TaxID=22663 RepID=A0A218WSV5_PUNGR|nr:uncharacterized protein LOC116212923 [Punica granatum]OWM75052.1 hypothetical protein CDL15_Pgr021403 [Punica granatum]PKI40039.1 hypothetical protein CRG98_039569 [Punica granatum]